MLNKSVVVTGASGFIGSHLCEFLKAEGCGITCLNRRPAAAVCDEEVVGDLTIPGQWGQALRGADVVFHLAGKAHALSEVKQDDGEYARVNTEATRNLLVAAAKAGVRRFVMFSTIKAMSRDVVIDTTLIREKIAVRASSHRPSTEDDFVVPDTPYGKSKWEAEKLVLFGGYVAEPVVLRLCMVYGAGTKGNMHKMMDAVRRRRFPPLPEIYNRRSMVHVDDVARAALLAAIHPAAVGEVFIVSDGHAHSTRHIYDLMCRSFGRQPTSWTVPLWCFEVLAQTGDLLGKLRGRRCAFDSAALQKLAGAAWFSSSKIEKLLGFKPKYDLQRGILEMANEARRR